MAHQLEPSSTETMRETKVLPPGTILQLMYLKERLSQIPAGRFIEIGPGNGEITRMLLDHGWQGVSYDLAEKTIEGLKVRFAKEISERRFAPVLGNYIVSATERADLVISCMVMEHLEDDVEQKYMCQSARLLNKNGLMIGLVPGSPDHWGIEDDIAGHCRRYTRESVATLASVNGWKLRHIAGLTFPVSNLLLPISNYLVNRNERAKLALSMIERTKQSGHRKVHFKTHFPAILGIILNVFTMYPLHVLQKLFKKSKDALVIYFEMQPNEQRN